MTTYYADFDLGTGDNDGTSWANAWRTMAYAIAGENGTAPAAGDTVYCRGTDTLAATATNGINGDETNGLVKWIGVNSSGNNDGTRAVLDCATGNFGALTCNGNFNLYENFEFKNSGNSSGRLGTGDDCVYINCSFNNNNALGFNGTTSATRTVLIRCCAYSNGSDGFGTQSGCSFYFCSSYDNSQSGFDLTNATSSNLIGCLSYDNGNCGYENLAQISNLFNCVADGNTVAGILVKSAVPNYIANVIGCRITNQSGAGVEGFDANTEIVLYGWNFFDNNKDHIANSTLAYAVTHGGTATNVQVNEDSGGGGDTLQGYTDDDPEDYNLASTATLRREPITIPTS